jgi:1,6-anhydro-N-acetylmuramate kinase
MSGTSLDALDVALIEVAGTGMAMDVRFVAGHSVPLGSVGDFLSSFAQGYPATAEEIAEATHEFSNLHLQAIRELLGGASADLISIHGQTVYHRPPVSWQLLQPTPIAHALGIPVVYDLRQADLAMGGQGAPLTPIADAMLLRGWAHPWAVINLGGFVNITRGPEISARDVCPGNLWLDALAEQLLDRPFDANGQVASSGRVDETWLRELRGRQAQLTAERRSLGTGDEALPTLPGLSAPDTLRTAIEAIALAIRNACAGAEDVLLAGGGRKNESLRHAIAQAVAPARVLDYDVCGVPSDYREAAAWAILGALSQDQESISLPSITGGETPIAGTWIYP